MYYRTPEGLQHDMVRIACIGMKGFRHDNVTINLRALLRKDYDIAR